MCTLRKKRFSNLQNTQQEVVKRKFKQGVNSKVHTPDCCAGHLSHQCSTGGGVLFRKGALDCCALHLPGNICNVLSLQKRHSNPKCFLQKRVMIYYLLKVTVLHQLGMLSLRGKSKRGNNNYPNRSKGLPSLFRLSIYCASWSSWRRKSFQFWQQPLLAGEHRHISHPQFLSYKVGILIPLCICVP